MWVEELDIRGFRRLRGEYRFSPKLTVVVGGNEAGKSSMHDALVRTLCGFSAGERRRYGGQSEIERCAPWEGQSFAINAVVHARDQRLRIEWDFSEHTVRLVNAETGEDLSGEVRGARNIVTLGQYLIGLGLEDFCEACCLGQAEISAVANSESLVVALQRAVESGATDTGVEDAKARLNEFLRNRIGVRVDNLSPNASGTLGALQARRAEVEESLVESESGRRELAELEQRRRSKQAERGERERELLVATQALMRERAESLADRLKRALEHRGRATVEAPDVLLPSEQQEADLNALAAGWERLRDEIAGLKPQADAARSSVGELEKRRASLQAQSDALDSYAKVNVESEQLVHGLVARLAELDTGLITSEAPEPTPVTGRRQRSQLLWAGAATMLVFSVAGGLALSPLAFAGLLVAGVLAYLASSERTAATSALPPPEQIEARRGDLQGELASALDAVDAPTLPRLDERAQAYLTGCRGHRDWNELQGQIGRVQTQLRGAREPISELERCQAEIERHGLELSSHLAEFGIETSDLGEGRREFEERARLAKDHGRKQAGATEAEEGYRTALGDLSLQKLQVETQEAAKELDGHVSTNGDFRGEFPQDQEPEARRDELREAVGELDTSIAGLEAQINDREEQLPSVPRLREEQIALSDRITRLERSAEAISLARDSLDTAAREARRTFQPHLQKALNKNLERITDGRYSKVEIDDELEISVNAPETGQMLPADELSRGTQDQIFLVERLEIANLLDPTTDGAPLLLDEPFVHFDQHRLPLGLELVCEETDERQVILFTTNPALAKQAKDHTDEVLTIELEAP